MQQYWEHEEIKYSRLEYHPLRHHDCDELKRVKFIVKSWPQTLALNPIQSPQQFNDPISSKGTSADTKILWATNKNIQRIRKVQNGPIYVVSRGQR